MGGDVKARESSDACVAVDRRDDAAVRTCSELRDDGNQKTARPERGGIPADGRPARAGEGVGAGRCGRDQADARLNRPSCVAFRHGDRASEIDIEDGHAIFVALVTISARHGVIISLAGCLQYLSAWRTQLRRPANICCGRQHDFCSEMLQSSAEEGCKGRSHSGGWSWSTRQFFESVKVGRAKWDDDGMLPLFR